MRRKSIYAKLLCVMFVVASGIVHPQQTRTLAIDGHPGQIPVIETDGKSCVEIEALARLTNGSLSFSGNNQITLALHGAPASQPESQGFSKGFLSAGIEAMSEIREWRSALQQGTRSYAAVE